MSYSHSTSVGAPNKMPDPVTIGAGVGWGISILGWVISPILSKLVNKGLDYLGDVTSSLAKNLQNLEKKVLQLKLMLEAARVSPEAEKKLEPWLKRLKSAFYDAEDIMDAIDYHRLAWKVTSHRESVKKKNQKAIAKKDSKFPPGSKDKLRNALKEIEKLIDEGEKLLPLLRLTTSGGSMNSSPEQTTGSGSFSKSSQTTSEPPKVFGRDEDAKKIISMLNDTTADDHSVIGIHGIAGSGKTTLVQYVCECVKKKNSGVPYFELIMWIHVTENFSVHTVYSEMLEIASGQKRDISNPDMLQSELKKSLKGRRFLLVLDDVWYSKSVNKQDNLKKLLSPLKESDKGSRVLVTSRTADAAKLLGAQNPIPISDMDKEEFFKMFMHYALDKSPVRDQDKGKFETIGREISLLLRKSPLAARTVAGQLMIRTRRAEDIGFWIDTLEQKNDLLKDTMGALWWSYHQLEEHVRQCFAYCSMFPRRHKLDRDKLVKMWMAQGFVDTSENSDMEVDARKCFEVLLSTSFIQLKSYTDDDDDDDDQEYYTIHDLLHDLAGIVAGSDSFTIQKDMVDHQIPKDVRHLFIDTDNLGEHIEQIVELDTLRTLVISGYTEEMTGERFERILRNLKKLRFLSVELMEFGGNVPECIGELKHLRYLALDDLSPASLSIYMPPTFTQLYHLQELDTAVSVRFLDSHHMADLENLRRISGAPVSIPDIGRMPWLQHVSVFTVKKEKGYEITQLENLNNIRGELYIRGLGNIKSKEDARRANLSNKRRVSHLKFDWESYQNEETGSSTTKRQKAAGHDQQVVTPPKPEEILEALHPPALLEELEIDNYKGSTFPSWLSTEDGKLEHLERLKFFNCHGSGSLFKFSKHLPKLKKIRISTCSWNTLPDNSEQLASLEELKIHHCTSIQSLPELPSSLKRLEITVCKDIKALTELPPSLEELKCEQYLVDSYPDRQAIARIKIEICG